MKGQPVSSVEQVLKMFDINDESLQQIKNCISKELELGLSDEENATIKMLITYVRELSRGDETGSYLALDLGGTHFRVLLVDLNDGKPKVTTATHDIPANMLLTNNGQELFDYIAIKLLEFVQQHKLKRKRISLGFTFSFPCKQYGLTQSILVKWCKGFKVGGVVGTDVVKQLKAALKRQLAGLVEAYIDVVAVINDTTGTLVACANTNQDCRIGLIVGTGFNACYVERLDKCEKWPANYTNPKQVIINCEWGAMGDNKKRRELDKFRNEFDEEIDAKSVNPHSQTYEKMVAGMYIGELLRLSILKLYKSKLLFKKMPDISLNTRRKTSTSATDFQQAYLNATANNKTKQLNNGGSGTSQSIISPRSPVGLTPTPPSSPGGLSLSSLNISSDIPSGLDISGHRLYIKHILSGRHLSMLAKDEMSGKFEETIKIMAELNVTCYEERDLEIMIQLSSKVIKRSANLAAAGVTALLERLKRNKTVIGYDGSVIKYHPYFVEKLVEKCSQLTPKEYKFEFMESSDGSGIGAAVVAAALHKERRPLYVVKPGKLYELHFNKNQSSSLSLSADIK